MKKITIFAIALVGLAVVVSGACSSTTTTTTTNTTTSTGGANRAAVNANVGANASSPAGSDDETPAAVKTALPDAQSFTVQHKDIPKDAIADIEKDTGAKVPDTDHHSYLAFSNAGGKRTQIGAATMVKAAGKDVVIIYENKAGSPAIREVRADGVSADFLKQFAGKGHDDTFSVGNDLKVTGGVDEATAKAIAQAVRIDSLTMQNLYGSAHSH